MSYFWSTFIQPLYEEEENSQPHQRKPLQPKIQPQRQQSQPKQERDPNASVPTAEAFKPKYVTRRPKSIVVPPPPPSTPEDLEDGECCTPTQVCVTRQPESLFNSTVDLYDGECTPTIESTSKFVFDSSSELNVQSECTPLISSYSSPRVSIDKLVFDFGKLELNKYNIQAECTPQHSVYNSPRLSVDKLDMFNWEPKFTTVNCGIFKDTIVNGGRVQPRSLPSSPEIKRQRISSSTLGDIQYNLNSGIQELARLQRQFENLSIQLLDLQTNM